MNLEIGHNVMWFTRLKALPKQSMLKVFHGKKWTDDDAIAELKERKWWFTEADWSWFLLTHGHKISEVEYA